MRKLLTFVVAVLVPIAVLAGGKGDRWPDTGGGGTGSSGGLASGELGSLLENDNLQFTYVSGDCNNWNDNTTSTITCTNTLARRFVTRAITQVRWELIAVDTPSANSGCAATLVTSDGDIATTTKPLLGDAAVAGHTLLDVSGDGYVETVTVALTAGEFIQVRWDTVAAGSAGADGSCANAAGTDTHVYIYAN